MGSEMCIRDRTSYARYASPKKARNVCSSTKVLASISGMDQEQSLDWVRAILKQFLSRTLSPPLLMPDQASRPMDPRTLDAVRKETRQ